MNINRIYPGVNYPVGRNTTMVSPLIRWDHKHEYTNPHCHSQKIFSKMAIIDVNDLAWNFLHGHVVDGTTKATNMFLILLYLNLREEDIPRHGLHLFGMGCSFF